MQTAMIKVSYRDKEANKNVPLGEIEVPRFDTLDEATNYFEKEAGEGKGVGELLAYVHTALDIELQRIHRDANRPDKPKASSNISKFKQLSGEKQEELLRAAGLLAE